MLDSPATTIPSTNTNDIMPMILPSTLSPSIFATDEDMAKNTNGITLTKRRFRKMSPIGLRLLTICGKEDADQTSNTDPKE
jgi:hypothetical protein